MCESNESSYFENHRGASVHQQNAKRHHAIKQKATSWHRGSWPDGGRGLSPSTASKFEFSYARLSFLWCLICSLSLQGVQWAVGLVVVRETGPPGHPRKKKKKSNELAESFSFFC